MFVLIPFWKNLEYLRSFWNILKNSGIFSKKMEYFGNIWNISEKFGFFLEIPM